MSELFADPALEVFARQIDEWLARFAATSAYVEQANRDLEDDRRWYLRMRGEAKGHTTIWLHLGQRTLRYETYVMPAPEDNVEAVWENALRRNERLVGAHFSIGVEDALFLRGEIPLVSLSEAELDRAVGTLYQTVETVFPSLLALGFETRLRHSGTGV